jgi:hypothetical protein
MIKSTHLYAEKCKNGKKGNIIAIDIERTPVY